MAEKKEEPTAGILYECVNCAERLTAEQMAMTPEIKCPFCGSRILKKVRPPIVKRIRAR